MPATKQFDLIERCVRFAKAVRDFVKRLPKSDANREYGRQLLRSSGAVGANYIEANDALGSKDFFFRNRIARKEAKESRYWLELVDVEDRADLELECRRLIQEAHELKLILSSIIEKQRPDR